MTDFIEAVIDALQQATYEAGVGIAEHLRQQREVLLDLLNP
ncbi:hypothetical protein [Fibrella forsythiae]|nr:hypothetical protein [Fibrella forsythiae]